MNLFDKIVQRNKRCLPARTIKIYECTIAAARLIAKVMIISESVIRLVMLDGR